MHRSLRTVFALFSVTAIAFAAPPKTSFAKCLKVACVIAGICQPELFAACLEKERESRNEFDKFDQDGPNQIAHLGPLTAGMDTHEVAVIENGLNEIVEEDDQDEVVDTRLFTPRRMLSNTFPMWLFNVDYSPQNIAMTNEGLVMTLNRQTGKLPDIVEKIYGYLGTRISTKMAFEKGYRFDFFVKFPSGLTNGVVTSLYLSSDTFNFGSQDEINLEYIGKYPSNRIKTNYYIKGKGSSEIYVDFPSQFDGKTTIHKYSIIYGAKSIFWLVDDKIQKQLTISSSPFTKKMKAAISIWDASALGPWAGAINWNNQQQFDLVVANFLVTKIKL